MSERFPTFKEVLPGVNPKELSTYISHCAGQALGKYMPMLEEIEDYINSLAFLSNFSASSSKVARLSILGTLVQVVLNNDKILIKSEKDDDLFIEMKIQGEYNVK